MLATIGLRERQVGNTLRAVEASGTHGSISEKPPFAPLVHCIGVRAPKRSRSRPVAASRSVMAPASPGPAVHHAHSSP
jgi:hypothetical protein